MMQDVRTAPALRERVIEPLEREDLARRKAEREKTARTRVAFFTMVRGE
jgi:alpha-D-ribose 1-methylphosphonate 5-triphosphate synthase subunit PhnG